jgi:hypothetical protein
MIISLDEEMKFEKIPTPFHSKSTRKMKNTWDIPQHNEDNIQQARK